MSPVGVTLKINHLQRCRWFFHFRHGKQFRNNFADSYLVEVINITTFGGRKFPPAGIVRHYLTGSIRFSTLLWAWGRSAILFTLSFSLARFRESRGHRREPASRVGEDRRLWFGALLRIRFGCGRSGNLQPRKPIRSATGRCASIHILAFS